MRFVHDGRTGWLAAFGLALGVAFATSCINVNVAGLGAGELEERVVEGEGAAKILLLDLDGMLTTSPERGPLGLRGRESVVARTRAVLDRAREDEDVRAVVLRIESPGGTVTASEVLYREIERFRRETGRPVVAQLMGTATSGAYYAAMAAQEVRAHPTTVTGSIGVLFAGVSVAGLMEKLGIEDQTLKTGPYKDTGSPLRRMTEAERAHLQGVLDELEARFVEVVAAGRPGLGSDQVEALADGRIWTARQAKDLGLVDAISDLPETLEAVKARIGVQDARIVVYQRPGEWRDSIYARGPAAAEPGAELRALAGPAAGPAFLYLWWPGAGL